MDSIVFDSSTKITFESHNMGVTLDLETTLGRFGADKKLAPLELLLWATIAATREQTEAIREFTRFVEKQTAATHERAKGLTPDTLLDLVTERFPDILASLGGAPVPDATGPRTIRHGKGDGETDSVT